MASLQTMSLVPQSPSSGFPFSEYGLDLLWEPGSAGRSTATVQLIWLKMSVGACLHSGVSSLSTLKDYSPKTWFSQILLRWKCSFLQKEHHLTGFLCHPLLGALQLEEDIFKDLCIFDLCAYVCACVCHACTSAHGGHRMYWSPGTGVKISCEFSDVGGRNWAQVS